MKLCLLAVVTSGAMFAATAVDFMTGQAARLVIGQVNFTQQDQGTPTQFVLGACSGLAYANNTLFVVDSNHIQATPGQNRVLIYHNLSSLVPPPTTEIPQGTRCPVCVGNQHIGSASLVVGQTNFSGDLPGQTQTGLYNPSAVASDGKIMVVADTDSNRVLIWKNIPTTNGAPADIVLGQDNFTSGKPGISNKSLRGPQGVWIQGTRLFVADTQNSRVLVWNTIPTTNNQPADYVLGEPDFTTAPPPTTLELPATSSNLFSPVSVTSDGQRLFVTDLGHSRVLIWNSIPTETNAAADVVVGQPDMTSDVDNNSAALCKTNGKDASGNPTYPASCYGTLSLPRYALSDGTRLFVADGGNDRVLVFNTIPTKNGTPADEVLGQPDEFTDRVTDADTTFDPNANVLRSSPAQIRTPMSLAWDGSNLYVSDPFDRRVLVFTPALPAIPVNGITNSASRIVSALGSINFGGTVTAKDTITVTIDSATYAYTVADNDSLALIILNITDLINGVKSGKPDPNVIATAAPATNQISLTARTPGLPGNNVTYSVAVAAASSTGTPTETAATAGANLTGGQNAGFVAPGTLVTLTGKFLSDGTATGVPNSQGFLPTKLAGVEVYFDGIRAPLLYVSPTQINAQLPFEVSDSNGVTAFVRTERQGGPTTATVNIAVPVVASSPGIFALNGTDPRRAYAYHTSNYGIAVVSVDGTIQGGDVATISIEDRVYHYTVQATDTLATIRDGFITLINSNGNEKVTAEPAGQFTRIVLTAKVPGPPGDGIKISGTISTGALVLITVLGSQQTCCSSVANAPVTADNPAVPGEVITIFAAGLGTVTGAGGTTVQATGKVYDGPAFNTPNTPVDNAQVGGLSANVLFAGLEPGTVGVYRVVMQLDPNTPTNA
ncbi:MAG TPA: hypothetical protein VKT81_13190, partial [Bryobacteraceae bacterium]|nr:hypothetical protein [Bryobacteraceae bacterium]